MFPFYNMLGLLFNFPARAWMSRGLCDRGLCPYVGIYVCGPPKSLNGTLAIDSRFETFAVGLLVEFITSSTTAHSRNATLSSKSRIFLYIMHTLLYLSGWMTQLPARMQR